VVGVNGEKRSQGSKKASGREGGGTLQQEGREITNVWRWTIKENRKGRVEFVWVKLTSPLHRAREDKAERAVKKRAFVEKKRVDRTEGLCHQSRAATEPKWLKGRSPWSCSQVLAHLKNNKTRRDTTADPGNKPSGEIPPEHFGGGAVKRMALPRGQGDSTCAFERGSGRNKKAKAVSLRSIDNVKLGE